MTITDAPELMVRDLMKPLAESGGLTLRRETAPDGHAMFVLKINKDVGRLTPYFDLVGMIEAELIERNESAEIILEYPD